jgi:hypothetical protein
MTSSVKGGVAPGEAGMPSTRPLKGTGPMAEAARGSRLSLLSPHVLAALSHNR